MPNFLREQSHAATIHERRPGAEAEHAGVISGLPWQLQEKRSFSARCDRYTDVPIFSMVLNH
jgi:hypothetical protein